MNFANIACCILVVGGGFLAAYLYMKDAPPSAKPPLGDGLKLGLLTGLIGAVAFTTVLDAVGLSHPGFWSRSGLPQLDERRSVAGGSLKSIASPA